MNDLLGLIAFLIFAGTCVMLELGHELRKELDGLKDEVKRLRNDFFSKTQDKKFPELQDASVMDQLVTASSAANGHAYELLKEVKAIRAEIDPLSFLREE